MAGYSVTYSVVDNATKQIDAINRRIMQARAPMDRLSRSVSRFVDVSGLRKVAQGFDWIGKAAGSVLRTLTAIVPVMGAITGAASIAGMVKLVNSYAAWSRELVQNADNIGTTTQQLQQFQDATRLAGGDAGDMTESLKGLHNTLGNINVGTGNAAAALQWLNRLGIDARDAGGHIRSTTELMPEMIQRIAAMRDPIDRARAANELLGASGDKLIETFRQSSQTFAQWFSDVHRYRDLTDDQKQSLQQFGEAQGRVGVAFDRLGQQVSVVLARDFEPLLTKFALFVEKHTPEIVKAVDDISQRFVAWLGNVDWSKVENGIGDLIDSLKWVINNLDTIKTAAEVIAALFIVKWGVGVVKAIGAVTTAIGSAGGAGAAGGVGLVGALNVVAFAAAAVAGVYAGNKAGQRDIADKAKAMGFDEVPGGAFGMPSFRNPTTGESMSYEDMMKRQGRPAGGGGWIEKGLGAAWDRITKGPEAIRQQGAPLTGLAATPFGGLIARGEGGYSSVNRGAAGGYRAGTEDLASKTVGEVMADQAAGRYNAAGRYQIIAPTLKTAAASMGLKGDEKFTPELQDRIFGEYLAGAKRPAIADYLSGRSNDLAAAQLAAAQEWASVADPRTGASYYAGVGNNRASISASEMADALKATRDKMTATAPAPPVAAAPAVAAAPPVAVGAPAPVNGSVDVSITHNNPPPNSSVTASGTGNVNVAPVRVEYQDMQQP